MELGDSLLERKNRSRAFPAATGLSLTARNFLAVRSRT